jgi:hypothetical protein
MLAGGFYRLVSCFHTHARIMAHNFEMETGYSLILSRQFSRVKWTNKHAFLVCPVTIFTNKQRCSHSATYFQALHSSYTHKLHLKIYPFSTSQREHPFKRNSGEIVWPQCILEGHTIGVIVSACNGTKQPFTFTRRFLNNLPLMGLVLCLILLHITDARGTNRTCNNQILAFMRNQSSILPVLNFSKRAAISM